MSGGVDSSYVLSLLLAEGYEVHAIYLKLHPSESYHENNLKNIALLKEYFDFTLHVLDLQEEFRKNVIDTFIDAYKNGITPNPCTLCNPTIKFGKAYAYAMNLGVEFLASGHYARILDGYIYKALDKEKDQSYFLYGLKKEQLPFLRFPLGEVIKSELKAKLAHTAPYDKLVKQKESQEICFVDTNYIDILRQNNLEVDKEGAVIDEAGNVIGRHGGYMHFTIGKRKGLDIPLSFEPKYVLEIDAKNNRIVAGSKEKLIKHRIIANTINCFIDEITFVCETKIRYRSEPKECFVSIDRDSATIDIKEGVSGVAIGQAVVFYDGEKLIGGGIITASA